MSLSSINMDVTDNTNADNQDRRASSSQNDSSSDQAGETAKRIKKETEVYWEKLSKTEIKKLRQSWKILFGTDEDAFISQFVRTLNNMANDDRTENEDIASALERMTPRLVMGTYDRSIQFLESGDFSTCYDMLWKIGEVHQKVEVSVRELLQIRKVLLKTVENQLGAGYTTEVKKAWLKFATFIQIGMFAPYKASTDIHYTQDMLPTEEVFAMVRNSFNDSIDPNMGTLLGLVYNHLVEGGTDITEVFTSIEKISVFKGIGRLVSLSHDPPVFIDTLTQLGAQHVDWNVRPRHFPVLNVALIESVGTILDKEFTPEMQNAWIKVFDFMANVMQAALLEADIVKMKHEASSLQLQVKLNHVHQIKPTNLSFVADLEFACTNSGSTSMADVFETTTGTRSMDQLAPWNITVQNSIDVEEHFRKLGNVTWLKSENSDLYQRGHLKGSFSQFFDMHNFPFDKHKLRLHFTCNASADVAKFDTGISSAHRQLCNVEVADSAQLQAIGGTDWDVFKPTLTVHKTKRSGRKKTSYSATIEIPIARRWGHAMLHIFFPLFCIDVVGLQSHTMNTNPIFHRLQIAVALLLTLYAFKWTIAQSLPPVSYMTYCDYHIFLSQILLLMHTTVACSLDALNKAHVIHEHIRPSMLSLLLFSIVLIFYIVCKTILIRRAMKILEKKDNNNHFKKTLNDLDKLQRQASYSRLSRGTTMLSEYEPSVSGMSASSRYQSDYGDIDYSTTQQY